jgi:hypothetical protein
MGLLDKVINGYVYMENKLQHLYNALRKETYNIVEGHAGELYCGIDLK